MPHEAFEWPDRVIKTILGHLPAKDIQRYARVSRQFKEIIDNEDIDFWRAIHYREWHRLDAYLDRYIEYADNPPFLEKLARWLEVRGVWVSTTEEEGLRHCVGSHDSEYMASSWICSNSFLMHFFEFQDFPEDAWHWLNTLVHELVDLHVARWKPPYNALVRSREDFIHEHALSRNLNFELALSARNLEVAFDARQIGQMYDIICCGTEPYFPTEFKEPPLT